MKEIRCPDCGYRLKTNECPICLKRVPFPTVVKQKTTKTPSYTQPRQTLEETPKRHIHIPVDMGKVKKFAQSKKKSKPAAIVAAVLALISLISSIVESCDISDSYAEPEYNYEAFVDAGVGEAEHVPQIPPRYIYENNGLTITVDGMGLYYSDYTIPVTVTNNTEQDVTIHSNDLSVNGYMLPSTGLFCSVEAGESAQAFLILSEYDLEETGITEIGTVEFWLDIYDSEEYTDIDKTSLITLETAIADEVVQPVDDSGFEVYQKDGVRIVIQDVEVSDYGSCDITYFAQNTTDMTVLLSDRGITLNDQEVSGMLWSTLRPHTQTVDRIYISDLEELGIKEISQLENLTLDLHVEHVDDYLYTGVVQQTENEILEIDMKAVME